jgi:16S rRNA (cytosine967-C5)-methyltransferase
VNSSNSSGPAPSHALPLARLLGHTADAVQAVRAGRSLTDVLAHCPADARAGTQALSFSVLRRLGGAQAARALLAPKAPPPAMDALLLTAIALLWPGDEAPAYAEHTLVDQAVTAAKQRSKAGSSFVNAVLRRFLREREAIIQALQRDLVASYNHPAWWIERLRKDWPDSWTAILQANNQRPPMTLRVNARRGTAADYVRRLAEEGMAAQVAGPQAVQLALPRPVTALPGFAEGDVSVQDLAAQLAAPLLIGEGLAPRARVLDACAAPGGKTAHLLELADAEVLAIDSDEQRLRRVHETLDRLSLRAQTLVADAGQPQAWWDDNAFDAILLDAPCSASGIVRRHPDVRWLRRPADIPALAATQARLLDALWPLLRAGGRLLYCTCSVFKAEGQDAIDAFLQRHGDAGVAPAGLSPGHLLPRPDNGAVSAGLGPMASADGFFYALLHKN